MCCVLCAALCCVRGAAYSYTGVAPLLPLLPSLLLSFFLRYIATQMVRKHFNSWHSVIGIAITLVTSAQAFFGTFSVIVKVR